MSNTNRCPDCSSNNTRRCELVYEQGVATIHGPHFDTMRVSSIAQRVSPPRPPISPDFWKARLLRYGLGAALFAGIGLLLLVLSIAQAKFDQSLFTLIPTAIGLFIGWHGWPPRGSLSQAAYQVACSEYAQASDLYRRLWICLDCGKIFKP